VFKGESIIQSGVEIDSVPQIFKWIENQLRHKDTGSSAEDDSDMKFPVLFETTRKLVRLYEVLA